ncbi:hypothetical protein [Kineococcus sp. G2]|uniref:hypothetical protein n=1 Tax=Kineococcus sp. G2 TaxID=3127484 RepID=UPI00301DA6C2
MRQAAGPADEPGNGEDGGEPPPGQVLPPQEARVRELLRAAAGAAGPMPADVAARVDAALTRARAEQDAAGGDAPGARVASLAGRRSRPVRWRRGLAAGAAAGVVAVGVSAVLQLDPDGGASSSTSAGAAADSAAAEAPDVRVLRSEADYAADAAVAAAGASLLEAPAGAGDTTTGGTATGGTATGGEAPGGGAPGGGAPGEEVPDALPGVDAERNLKSSALPLTGAPDESQRPAAEQALACARAVGVDAASVAAVQIAAWRSQPAALVVERPTAGEAGEVVVVALDCTPGQEPLNRVELPAVQAPASP